MNERIRELAEQAKAFIVEPEQAKIGEVSEVSFSKYSDLEKFAELLIKEYEKLLPEICPWDHAGKEGPMKGWHVQFVARKHFGIE